MDNRQQINAFIDAMITDPLNKQNTAARVRAVLKYIVQNAANLAEDDLGIDPNPAPAGVSWVTAPTITVSGTTVSVSQAEATFSGNTVSYDAITFEAVLAGDGLQRIDAVYGRGDGTYGYKVGDEGPTGVTPTIPTGTLIAGYTFFNTDGGQVQEPPTGDGLSLEQVLTLLGDYLPLQNPTRQQVTFGDPGGANWGNIDLDPYGLEINHYDGIGGASVYLLPDSPEWQSSTPYPLGRGAFPKLWAQGGGGQAGVMPYSLFNGGVGVRLYTEDGPNFHVLDFRDGKLYLNGVEFTGPTEPGTGATTFIALTDTPSSYTANKWLKVNAAGNAIEQVDAPTGSDIGTGALTHSGTVTVPLNIDGVYHTQTYPTTVTVSTSTNVLGKGAVLKITANGTAAPTVTGATKHNSSANFNTTNGTANSFRVWCEFNAAGNKTNFYIWTQQ